ncbi:hypothetical protein NHP194003_05250 [Helicobacter suis]|uniref:Uncharacterized protein n=1 Tax=Helicobacter suis TaxID=104628 RepID=A0A6J4CY78_9HELI|nr:hypothetical protein NHP190020_06610 [Helicobacter suis]BDR28170.1 hypothetical protein HSHS1_09310 [Helicobacter suis HS1]BCD47321.1 hypothetical protein NHP194003_05250 [Helicobacter suis]BCD49075.1 hypothetical protein NHP194004_05220 [Helicobacter suis]BCD50821.1 hypothetical protein NHP194022_04920 [Helicobacter suis]
MLILATKLNIKTPQAKKCWLQTTRLRVAYSNEKFYHQRYKAPSFEGGECVAEFNKDL